jgi:hypothetical protein
VRLRQSTRREESKIDGVELVEDPDESRGADGDFGHQGYTLTHWSFGRHRHRMIGHTGVPKWLRAGSVIQMARYICELGLWRIIVMLSSATVQAPINLNDR